MEKIRYLLIGVLLVVFLTIHESSSFAQTSQSQPTVFLYPNSGPPGTSISTLESGFPPSQSVYVKNPFTSQYIDLTTDSSGKQVVNITVPAGTKPGSYDVWAYANPTNSGFTYHVSAPFTVTATDTTSTSTPPNGPEPGGGSTTGGTTGGTSTTPGGTGAPQIILNPNNGPAGSFTEVTGNGFTNSAQSGHPIELKFYTLPAGVPYVSIDGIFQEPVQVPISARPGTYPIIAYDFVTGAQLASSTFTVTGPTSTSTSTPPNGPEPGGGSTGGGTTELMHLIKQFPYDGPPGTLIYISGTNWIPDKKVVIYAFSGWPPALTLNTDNSGDFLGEIQVPADTKPGKYEIYWYLPATVDKKGLHEAIGLSEFTVTGPTSTSTSTPPNGPEPGGGSTTGGTTGGTSATPGGTGVPQIILAPNNGPAGSTTEVFGLDFSGSKAVISVGGSIETTTSIHSDGTFFGSVTIPSTAPPGPLNIQAVSDYDNANAIFTVTGAALLPSTTETHASIPTWIKHTASWWSQGETSDAEFATAIGYLASNGIIAAESRGTAGSTIVVPSDIHIPQWIKNDASWWSTGAIDDSTFLQATQYMLDNNIITFTKNNEQTTTTSFDIALKIVDKTTGLPVDAMVTLSANSKTNTQETDRDGIAHFTYTGGDYEVQVDSQNYQRLNENLAVTGNVQQTLQLEPMWQLPINRSVTVTPQLTESCTSDSSCSSGQYCSSSGICTAEGGAGATCTASDQCLSPDTCTNDVCTAPQSNPSSSPSNPPSTNPSGSQTPSVSGSPPTASFTYSGSSQCPLPITTATLTSDQQGTWSVSDAPSWLSVTINRNQASISFNCQLPQNMPSPFGTITFQFTNSAGLTNFWTMTVSGHPS